MAESAALAARRRARGEAGSIGIGFTAGSSYGFLPRLVSAAKVEMPDVDLVLKEMRTAEQMEALASSRIDLGLVRLPIDRRGTEMLCVLREQLILAVPRNHPLSAARDPTLGDLDREPFIMYSPTEGRYFYDLLAELFRSADIAPSYVQYISQIHNILPLVSTGIGLALVPESAEGLHAEGVVLRPLQPRPKTPVELYAVWRRKDDNPTLRAFRSLVLQRFAASST
jgi:DNA-binding transcriptional LysR family regulator